MEKNQKCSLQVNCFDSVKRNELKAWARKNGLSIRILIYTLLAKKEEIQKIIKEAVENGD